MLTFRSQNVYRRFLGFASSRVCLDFKHTCVHSAILKWEGRLTSSRVGALVPLVEPVLWCGPVGPASLAPASERRWLALGTVLKTPFSTQKRGDCSYALGRPSDDGRASPRAHSAPRPHDLGTTVRAARVDHDTRCRP